jgi:RNA polymerase sigma-70 factor (ECF subfamily)
MFESAMIAMPEVPVAHPAAEHARLERMFATHHATLWRILRRRGLSRDAAADATQEAFTIAVERLHEIQPDDERSFLIRTALQVARTLGRRSLRWQLEDDMDQRGLEEGRATDQRRADIQLCDLALAKVDPDLAEVFVLFELEELSSPEIASLLEIPLGTVASRLRRARKEFRDVFARIERTMHREGRS